MARTTSASGFVVPGILLLLGFLVTSALVEERRREAQLPSRTAALIELIRTRQAAIDRLAGEARSLASRLAEVQRAQAAESERLRTQVAAVERVELAASAAAARGPGVLVELTDSETSPRTRGDLTDLRIQDVDLRLVVNALWRAGAEAIAVNGHRVAGTTAIRSAGDRILVNFEPIASPYRIAAIGEPERLESELAHDEIGEQFDVWSQVYGLGFAVRSAPELSVPRLSGGPPLEWATPVEEGNG